MATVRSYIQNRDFRKVLQCFPFSLDVLHTPNYHHMLQLVVVEVGGPERHHEVTEADERTVMVSEEADNHVAIEDSHGGLVTVLDKQMLSGDQYIIRGGLLFVFQLT